MDNLTLFPVGPFVVVDDVVASVRDGYLVAYRGHTQDSYACDLRIWFDWLSQRRIPVLDAKRLHIETYDRQMELEGLKPSTRNRKLIVICGFYRYAEQEDILAKSPGRYVRRPRVPQVSTSEYLERFELTRYLNAADAIGPTYSALCCLLALNGLRVSEALSATIAALAFANGHRTLTVVRKGGWEDVVPLAPRTFRTVLAAVGDRDVGPLLLNTLGEPMSRYSAAKAVRKVAKSAGITKPIGPHALRHTFISLGLDAGVPLRDMQVAAGHAQPSTTVRYDRRARNLDRHAAYVVGAYVGGG